MTGGYRLRRCDTQPPQAEGRQHERSLSLPLKGLRPLNMLFVLYPLDIVQDGDIVWAEAQTKFMAALDLANIPSAINTYERLLIWAAQCCQSISNGEEVNVITGATSTPIAQVQVAITADNKNRFIVTSYVPVDTDELNSSTAKTWMAAQDISGAQPHENLLSN